MTRARLVAAGLTVATLAAALALWIALPSVIAAAGLQRYGLLLRVVLLFAALSLADRLAARVAALFHPAPKGQTQDRTDDH